MEKDTITTLETHETSGRLTDSDFSLLIHNIMNSGKSWEEIDRMLAEAWVHVEQIVMDEHSFKDPEFEKAADTAPVDDIDIEPKKSREEIAFEKSLETVDVRKFKQVDRITELKVWDMVDFDIRWFLRFIVVKIKWLVQKNGKTYASCVVNAIKISQEKSGEEVVAINKYILNKTIFIELPLVKWETMMLFDNDNGTLVSFKIYDMKLLKWTESWFKWILSKLLW